jgi:Transposase DDE domain group 1
VLHIRLRKGSANSARGALRFVEELIARVERAGARGGQLLRADSGFWSNKIFAHLERAGWRYSVGVRLQAPVRQAVEAIEDDAWQTLADYPETSVAQIAETVLAGRRLVVRRVRTLDAQGELGLSELLCVRPRRLGSCGQSGSRSPKWILRPLRAAVQW